MYLRKTRENSVVADGACTTVCRVRSLLREYCTLGQIKNTYGIYKSNPYLRQSIGFVILYSPPSRTATTTGLILKCVETGTVLEKMNVNLNM